MLIQGRSWWQQGSPDVPLLSDIFAPCPGGSRGVPNPDAIYNLSSVFWVYPWVSYQLDIGRRPGGIPIRCPNHLNWLL